MKTRKSLHPRRLFDRMDRVVAPLTGIFLLLLLTCLAGGCRMIDTWPGTEVVTPSGVETTTRQTTTTATNPLPSPTPAVTTGVSTGTTPEPTGETTRPPDQTTQTTQTAATPTPTVTQQTWDDLDKLDNSKTGWYYVPAATLGADQPATLPRSVLDLIAPYDVFWQIEETNDKVLYLTMDNGYEYMNLTAAILDVARDRQVPITFFITGSYLARNPDLVMRMVAEGHQVANHTRSHPNLVDLLAGKGPQAVLDELTAVSAEYEKLTGREMPLLMRPPEGSYSPRLLALLDAAGYRTAFWSFAYRDWLTDDQPDPQAALQKILANLHPGSILLLHAVSETNAAILPDLIDEARGRGYTFSLLP
ncbi:MAG: polysaccharide deacetylase family protein [Bacillota bacterium]|nr:polysaccharide deacetylase family protein [Bacillota bacterium]